MTIPSHTSLALNHPSDSVVGHFERIAPVYDFLNRVISLGQDQRWRRELAQRLQLQPDFRVLDVSTGTGDQALAAHSVCPAATVVGLDPSPRMIAGYRRKNPSALLVLGKAEMLPFADGSFDRATCSFGVRNFSSRQGGLQEISRILKPGGLWGFLEMSAPTGTIFPAVYAFYFKILVPLMGALFSLQPQAYRYLRDSVYVFPGFSGMKSEHEKTGFLLAYYKPILKGAVGLYVFQKKG